MGAHVRASREGSREVPEFPPNGENQLPCLAASTVLLAEVGQSGSEERWALGKARTDVIMSPVPHIFIWIS